MFGKKQPGGSPPENKAVKAQQPAATVSVPEPEQAAPAGDTASQSPEMAVQAEKAPRSEPPTNSDDIFTLHEEMPAESEAQQTESLRLQRARNRIWLDLRDGIDLKALARMRHGRK
jgi:pilus assembly protein CpaF